MNSRCNEIGKGGLLAVKQLSSIRRDTIFEKVKGEVLDVFVFDGDELMGIRHKIKAAHS